MTYFLCIIIFLLLLIYAFQYNKTYYSEKLDRLAKKLIPVVDTMEELPLSLNVVYKNLPISIQFHPLGYKNEYFNGILTIKNTLPSHIKANHLKIPANYSILNNELTFVSAKWRNYIFEKEIEVKEIEDIFETMVSIHNELI